MRGKKKVKKPGAKTRAKKIGTTKKAATRKGAAGRASSLAIKGELRANLMAQAEKAGNADWKDFAIQKLNQ